MENNANTIVSDLAASRISAALGQAPPVKEFASIVVSQLLGVLASPRFLTERKSAATSTMLIINGIL